MQKIGTQAEWVARAAEVLPGGGFGNFDPSVVIRAGKDAHVWDEDGTRYIDYLIGSGPMLLGHGNAEVQEAIFGQIPKGMTFFASNSAGIELAEQIVDAVECAQTLRYVSSGGEADMYAMRLARAFTGRADIMAHFDMARVGAEGWLMQLGTLSGNPVAAVAGMKTMEILRRDGQYDRLRALGRQVMDMAGAALDEHGIAHRIVGDPTLFEVVFAAHDIRDYRDVLRADSTANATFNATLRAQGLFKSAGKTYPCLALSEADLDHTRLAYQRAGESVVRLA